jgi:hypothetical protein
LAAKAAVQQTETRSESFIVARSTIRAPFTTARSLFVKDLGKHNGGAKGTALSFSFWRTARAPAIADFLFRYPIAE